MEKIKTDNLLFILTLKFKKKNLYIKRLYYIKQFPGGV